MTHRTSSDISDSFWSDGFTLLELLVVIAIIAIIAGILMPVLNNVKISGQATASSNNLRQLATANAAYASDNDGVFCPAQEKKNLTRWHGARTSTKGTFDPKKGYLAPYLGTEARVKTCPLFTNMVAGTASFENSTGGYGYNEFYIGGTPSSMYQPNRVAQVAHPTRTVMFTTTAYATGSSVQEYPYCEPPYWPSIDGSPSGARPSPSVHFRFRGKALVAWCDGHVTAEAMQSRDVGDNPNGGDATKQNLGWFGPDENNGYWNPDDPPTP